MTNIRSLLSQSPTTFNELLDLFEAYIAAVREPIFRGHTMIREEIGGGEHTALGYIFGVASDSDDMAVRLKQIRVARNIGSDVSLTLTALEANQLVHAANEVDIVLSAAGNVFELLHDGADADTGSEHTGSRAAMALAQRCLMETDERQVSVLRRLINKLHAEQLRLQTHCFQAFGVIQAPQGELIDEQSFLAERGADGAATALLSPEPRQAARG